MDGRVEWSGRRDALMAWAFALTGLGADHTAFSLISLKLQFTYHYPQLFLTLVTLLFTYPLPSLFLCLTRKQVSNRLASYFEIWLPGEEGSINDCTLDLPLSWEPPRKE